MITDNNHDRDGAQGEVAFATFRDPEALPSTKRNRVPTASRSGREQPAIPATVITEDEPSATSENLFKVVRPLDRSGRNAFPSKASRDSAEVRPNDGGKDAPGPRKARRWAPEPGQPGYQTYLAFLTLGVIYGDIGTSPLYTLTSTFPVEPTSPESVIGGISLMIWTLIITVAIKYVIFILMADDFGEGGTFALFAVLGRALRAKVKDDKVFRAWHILFSVIAIIGVSAILADGVLTPAISVMGAIDGLKFVSPNVDQNVVVGVSMAIIFLFFLPQRFGTSKVSVLFSPVVLLWYAALAGIGIYNITRFPRILEAFNPVYLGRFLGGMYENGNVGGWQALGSAFLTVTGSEALYADLGHFNKRAVRTSALVIVLPALILCYLGQGAALILDPSARQNGFFLTLPSGFLYPMLVLSVLAAIVASQALVTATFSLIAQAVRLQYFPRVNVVHTDRFEFGQVYIPELNYFLMVLVLVVIIGFRDVVALGYAYGVTVSLAFFLTTLLFSVVVVVHFNRHVFWGILFFAVFGLIDANFLAANLTKFKYGGWFSVVISLCISSVLIVWRAGRSRMTEVQATMNRPLTDLYKPREIMDDTRTIKQIIHPVQSAVPQLLICYASPTTKQKDTIPAAFVHFSERFPVKPQHLVFVTVAAVSVAFIVREFQLERISDGVYRVSVEHGYCERAPSAEEIAAFVIRELDLVGTVFPPPTDKELLRFVDPTFIVGRDRVVLDAKRKPSSSCGYRLVVEMFQVLHFFSRPPQALLGLPFESTLEVGLQVPI